MCVPVRVCSWVLSVCMDEALFTWVFFIYFQITTSNWLCDHDARDLLWFNSVQTGGSGRTRDAHDRFIEVVRSPVYTNIVNQCKGIIQMCLKLLLHSLRCVLFYLYEMPSSFISIVGHNPKQCQLLHNKVSTSPPIHRDCEKTMDVVQTWSHYVCENIKQGSLNPWNCKQANSRRLWAHWAFRVNRRVQGTL